MFVMSQFVPYCLGLQYGICYQCVCHFPNYRRSSVSGVKNASVIGNVETFLFKIVVFLLVIKLK